MRHLHAGNVPPRYVEGWSMRRAAAAIVGLFARMRAEVEAGWPAPLHEDGGPKPQKPPRPIERCPDCGAVLDRRETSRAPWDVPAPRFGEPGKRRRCRLCYDAALARTLDDAARARACKKGSPK